MFNSHQNSRPKKQNKRSPDKIIDLIIIIYLLEILLKGDYLCHNYTSKKNYNCNSPKFIDLIIILYLIEILL
jgi:hypothetical protein